MKQETPRSAAIDILCEWQKTGQSIDQIKEQFGTALPDPRDNQLASALVFGVLRQRGQLDYILAQFSSHPLKKMKPLTLQALRVGLYQLLHMDRIPASAAINETVQVIKSKRQPKWLSGFVNGLLRNVSRKIESFQMDFELPLHAQLSHPQWLIDRWASRFGSKKAEEICRTNNTPSKLCLCVNTRKTDRDTLRDALLQSNIKAEPGIFSPEALIVPDYHGSITNLPGFAEGLFQVQDETAQLVVHLLSPFPSGNYLDGCAGLGGKTSLLGQYISPESTLTAVEPQKGRNILLGENLARLGCSRQVSPFAGDLSFFAKQCDDLFTGILIDAPCSGTGVIRRHPDIRWNRKPEDFIQFQQKQLNILQTAAKLVAPNGVLVYATCSVEAEENQEAVTLFLQNHSEFHVENAASFLPKPAAQLVDAGGFLSTTPGPTTSDGFFAARLRKN